METGPRVAHAVSSGTCATSAWLRDGAAHGDVAGAWTNVTGQVGGLSHADAAPPKRCAKTEWLLASRLSATSLRRQLLVAWPDFAASAS